MEHVAFVERVLSRLPSSPSSFKIQSWKHAGRPTKEAVGCMSIASVVPSKVIDAIMDVDHYVSNLKHVAACHSIADARFEPPDKVRFYQKLTIPVVGAVQHELVLHRMGSHGGYEVAAWDILPTETGALNKRDGYRSDYNHGAWFAAPGVLAYALGSAPRRADLGYLKWKALTTGADAAAARVLKANLEGMAAWSARRS